MTNPSPTTPARDPAEAMRSIYALVVGLGCYRDPSILPLRFAHADASAFRNLLLDAERAGLPPENVRLLLDDQATLFAIKDALSSWLFQEADADATVLVFFAGHGAIESDRTGLEKDGIAKYLLPWDAVPGNLFASALSADDLRGLLTGIRAKRVAVFLDSCYAGGVATAGARAAAPKTNPWERFAEGEGRIVLAAAQPNERSFEDENVGHGLFTYHLLEALQGKADADGDGLVTIAEVFKYLQKMLPASAARLANAIQKPLLLGSLSQDIVLTVDAARARQQMEDQRLRLLAGEQQKKSRGAQLFKLYDEGRLPVDAYAEAQKLVERDSKRMTADELKLHGFLLALLSGGVGPEEYLESRARLLGLPASDDVRNAPSADVSGGGSARRAPKPPPPERAMPPADAQRFCIHCGTRMRAEVSFCTGCGKRL